MRPLVIHAGVGIAAALLPTVAYAQTTIITILLVINVIVGWLVPIVVSIGILLFLLGLVRYIFQTDTVEGKQAARDIMVWGIIAIFVMVSVWGFVNLLQILFGVRGLIILPRAWPAL